MTTKTRTTFDRPHKDGGRMFYDKATGKCLGHVLPTVPADVLAASPGIQSWSK